MLPAAIIAPAMAITMDLPVSIVLVTANTTVDLVPTVPVMGAIMADRVALTVQAMVNITVLLANTVLVTVSTTVDLANTPLVTANTTALMTE